MANAANNTQQIGQLIMYRVSRHNRPQTSQRHRIRAARIDYKIYNNSNARDAAVQVCFIAIIELCK